MVCHGLSDKSDSTKRNRSTAGCFSVSFMLSGRKISKPSSYFHKCIIKKTYCSGENCLSPDLSLRIQTDPELSSVVTAWTILPPDVRKMIVGVVQATRKGDTHQQ